MLRLRLSKSDRSQKPPVWSDRTGPVTGPDRSAQHCLASMLQRGKLIAINKTKQMHDDDGNLIRATHRPIMIGTILYIIAYRLVNKTV